METQTATKDARRLDRRQAAAFLTERGYRTAPATLAKLACVGGGPPFKSFGRRPIYEEPDLIAWAEARTTGPRRSTSDPGQPAEAPIRGRFGPESLTPEEIGEMAGNAALGEVEAKYGRRAA